MQRRRLTSTSLDEALGLVTAPVQPQASPLVRLRMAWASVCGSVLARHSEALSLEAGRLVVGARGSDWREVLFQERKALLQRVRRWVPGVHEVRLVTLAMAPPAPRRSTEGAAPPDARTEGVADADLRAACDGLLAARHARTTRA